jgi:hypothetical protein
MENNFIQLRKVREFGDVFNDTFAFIKQEAKPLGIALATITLPVVLVMVILLANIKIDQVQPGGNIAQLYSKVALILLLVFITQVILMLTVFCYFKLYLVKGPRNFDNKDLLIEMAGKFFPVAGSSLVMGIIIFFGAMMCGLPGIYLAISLSLVLPVMILEDKDFGRGFSRSFELTHKQWWWTLLIIFVYVVLTYSFQIILSIPGILLGISTLFGIKTGVATDSDHNIYFILYNAFTTLISTFFTVVLYIAIVFQYFNIVELHEGNTLSWKIDQIGNDEQVPAE